MKRFFIFLAVIVMLLNFTYFNFVYANGVLDVSIKIGYNGKYMLEYLTPAKVILKNNGADVIKGKVVFEACQDKEGTELYSFSKEFELAGNSAKEIYMSVLFSRMIYNPKYFLKVFASNGKLLYKTNITPQTPIQTTPVGIFSYQNYVESLFNSLTFSNATPILLDAQQLPKKAAELDIFDTIIIHNYDTSKLSPEQYRALKEYVLRGGNLVICLGENFQKNLLIFSDKFLQGTVGGLKTGNIEIWGSGEDTIMAKNIKYVDFKLKDSNNLGSSHIQYKKIGKGVVLVTSFDLFDEKINEGDKLRIFEKVFSILNSTLFDQKVSQIGSAGFYNFWNCATNVRWPSFKLVLVLLFIYIILVSFGSFALLKKLNKRHLYWHTTVVISIVFTIFLFVFASYLRVRQPAVNITNLMVINSDNRSYLIDRLVQVFIPAKVDIEVTNEGEQKFEPFTPFSLSYNSSNVNPIQGFEYKDDKGIFYRNLSPISFKVFRLEHIVQDSLPLYITSEFVSQNKIKVCVENKSDFEIDNLFVVFYNSCVYFEKVLPHKKLVKDAATSYSSYYEMFNDKIINNGATSTNEYQKRQRIVEILSIATERTSEDTFAVGYIKDYKPQKVRINSKDLLAHTELVFVKDLKTYYNQKGKVIVPFGMVAPTITSNTFTSMGSPDSRVYYSKGEIEAVFDFSKFNFNISKVTIAYGKGADKHEVLEYIYNFKKSRWDSIEIKDLLILKDEDLKKYIKDKKIKIKLEGKSESSLVRIPLVSVEGGEK